MILKKVIYIGCIVITINGCSNPVAPVYYPDPQSTAQPVEIPVYQPPAEIYIPPKSTRRQGARTQGYENTSPNVEVQPLKNKTIIRKNTALENNKEDRLDPYTEKTKKTPMSSIAVKTLIIRANVDASAGRNDTAIEKLERALRIEPENANVWYKIAFLTHKQKKHQQAVSLAKRSLFYADEDKALQRQNWKLIATASRSMGDMRGMKAAIRKQSMIR